MAARTLLTRAHMLRHGQHVARSFATTSEFVPPDQVRALYRQVIKNAKVFPSKNRDGMVREIRIEFRENAVQPDASVQREQVALAYKSLEQLRAYTGLSQSDSSWSVKLETTPMPKPERA